MIKILFLGDVFGRPGRHLVRELLPSLVSRHEADLVLANAENAAGGVGLTVKAAEELFSSGVDLLTTGNHIFRHKEVFDYLDQEPRVIRPANYPPGTPGRGSALIHTPGGVAVGVINVLGRVFMAPLDCPFRTVEAEAAALKKAGAAIILVDIHAEATSEKRALAFHMDGKVGAILGTHTHVQTADEEILPGGTAYLTDLGMTGPHDSVIGMKKEGVIYRFLTGCPSRFEAARRGLRLEGAMAGFDPCDGRAKIIERFQEVLKNDFGQKK